MDLDTFCRKIKENYPEISAKTDNIYDDYWNRLVQMEFSSYSWFESLANTLNSEMKKKVAADNYQALLKTISTEYDRGESGVMNAIDVAFVENLFWQVKIDDAQPYWEVMPENLKELYVGFHGQEPL
ncbi:hypothetical protein HXX02_06855 [Microbulbifer elongatus]|uniref:DUF7674 domain-containing protein n=1 Tax=Microbulbifer elongatus TaxID=86173 RepID=A0ABT1P209_9GAMM|nr:hypothetical protein [Microbulbifer elongatus]MCQ3829159.1 hypothetical protein [Microbulbifer elongatus]